MRPSASVVADADERAVVEELDADAGGRPARAGVEHVGRDVLMRRIFAPGAGARARSPPRRRSRGARRARPPRRRRRAGRRAAGLRRRAPRRGRRRPPSSSPSVRQTARSAHMPGSIEPMSSRREHRRAAARAEPERLACRQRLGPAAAARDEQRLLDLEGEVAALVRGRAVDAEADADARVEELAHRRDPGAEAQVRRRAMRDAGAARRRSGRCRSSERWTQCAHQTSPRASRAAPGTRPAGSRRARGSTPPPRPSRRGACGAGARAAVRAPPTPPSAAPVTENGEHGATAIWTRAVGRLVQLAARRSVSASTSSSVLDERVRRQPAVRLAEVHRAA